MKLFVGELLLHFPDVGTRGLELGCGTGDLYPYFRDRLQSYVGVDFSPSMLKRFRKELGPLPLVCADASLLPLGRVTFDVIFSNGLCQYLNDEQLRQNLRQARGLLAEDGVYIIGGIPDAQLRLHYYSGAMRPGEDASILGGLRMWLRAVLLRRGDMIGHWYSRRQLGKLAEDEGYTCETFGSTTYEYRFHAVLRKRAA